MADYFRWQIALGTRDSAGLARARARFDQMSDRSLDYIAIQSIMDGLPLGDARRASDARMSRPTTKAQRAQVAGARYQILTVAGRPGEAAGAERIAETSEDRQESADRLLYRALYLGGDTAGLSATLEGWARTAGAPPAPAKEERGKQLKAACGLAEWHLAAGRPAEARPFLGRLRGALARGDSAALPLRTCATLLDAWSAAIEGAPGAGDTLRLLDSLMRRGQITNGDVPHANLIAARAFERHGDLTGALAAVRRRIHHLSWGLFIGPSLREEARLAAMTGDREGAIRALRHWLALHDDPEEAVRPQVDAARAELAKLVGEPQDR
jgi:hypothetical protein